MARRSPWTETSVKYLELSSLGRQLQTFLLNHQAKKVLLVTDEVTNKLCLKRVQNDAWPSGVDYLTLPQGEKAKEYDALRQIWQCLLKKEYTATDLIVGVGGGALSDIVAFAAATYKRGIHLVLIPTTLLAAVDAVYGGKCAINFEGVKNSIGTYYPANEIWVVPPLWSTLPAREMLSGMGELLKYAILAGEQALSTFLQQPSWDQMEPNQWACLVRQSLDYKRLVVAQDPYDQKGIRAALNLGHTYAHAFEGLYLLRNLPLEHGIAVAAGIVCELYLSMQQGWLTNKELLRVIRYVQETFPPIHFSCQDYPLLFALANQDKKNDATGIKCTTVQAGYTPVVLTIKGKKEWEEALDFYREYMRV